MEIRQSTNIFSAPNEMLIRVVTDSTSDIPAETAAEHGISVVPAYVNIGDRSYLDDVELSREEFYKGLPTYTSHPTTAAPSPGSFTEVYNRLAKEGAKKIVSIHIAGKLSGILNAARIGAEAAEGVDISILDSQQLTMGLGLLVIKAAEAAAKGVSINDVIQQVQGQIPRTFVFGILDTLEYLRKSGRVGWAEFSIGTLLKIKPMVRVYMSEVEMLEKVRSRKPALSRMIKRVTELGDLEAISLLHIRGSEMLDELYKDTSHLYPKDNKPLAVELTPALGAHIGPGGLGIACIAAAH